MEKVKNLIYQMLTENTGVAMMDSGGDEGRNWQKNRKKKRKFFENQKAVEYDKEGAKNSDEILLTVNIYPYLTSMLELDKVCDDFNRLECDEWDSEFYGISKKQEQYMTEVLKLEPVGDSFNTYNGESFLSQVLQGHFFEKEGNQYVLLQIHGGADVRGGYTDAKLFKTSEYCYLDSTPIVYGTIDGVAVSTGNSGYSVVQEDTSEPVPLKKDSKIELFMSE